MIEVKLTGLSLDWLTWNSSWGNLDSEPVEARSARLKIMAAPHRKVGRGIQVRVELELAEAQSLVGILDSIAGNMETWTTEERGTDGPAMRAMRWDVTRTAAAIKAAG